jgi:hypothetical protein
VPEIVRDVVALAEYHVWRWVRSSWTPANVRAATSSVIISCNSYEISGKCRWCSFPVQIALQMTGAVDGVPPKFDWPFRLKFKF